MSDYQLIKKMLEDSGHEIKDEMSGLPRRHFIISNGVVFRFEPDDSLSEVFPEYDN